MRRPAAKVPTAAEMGATAKVAAAMMTTAEMRVAVAASVTTTMAATVTPAMTAAFRDGISGRRQRGRQNNDGNPDSEF
jgi:PPE-repeat protein